MSWVTGVAHQPSQPPSSFVVIYPVYHSFISPSTDLREVLCMTGIETTRKDLLSYFNLVSLVKLFHYNRYHLYVLTRACYVSEIEGRNLGSRKEKFLFSFACCLHLLIFLLEEDQFPGRMITLNSKL